MRLQKFIFGLLAMLAMATSIHQPLLAAQKQHSSSSSTQKEDKFCKKANKLLKQIDQTTMQDLVVDQNILNVVNQINQTTTADLAVDQEILADVEQLLDCSCDCIVIEPADFEDVDGNLTQTYVITTPGSYCLGADINFAPVVDYFMPAIRILSDDVRLDLRGFTLNQVPGTAFDVAAIRIGVDDVSPDTPVFKNITILNGSITNFTGTGIDCENFATFFDVPVAFESITMQGLNILDCGSSPSFAYNGNGINLISFGSLSLYDPAVVVGFRDIIIENCNVNRCLGNGAIAIATFENAIVANTQANDCSSQINVIGTVFGYVLTGRNLQMFKCQGNGTSDFDPAPASSEAEVGGVWFLELIDSYVQECQFNDSFGEADVLVGGGDISNSHNTVFENCQFNNARGGASAQIVNGAHASDGPDQRTNTNGIKFLNCQFNGAQVSDLNPGGLDQSLIAGILSRPNRNMIFEDCQACNIITTNLGYNAYGFSTGFSAIDPAFPFGNDYNLTFSKCVTSDIQGGKDAIGIDIFNRNRNHTGHQGSLANIVIENCISERISSSSSSLRVAGIAESLNLFVGTTQFAQARNLFIRGCRVSDVRSNTDEPSLLSAGILVESVINPVLENNSVSDCDRGILLTGINDIIPNGFQLAASLADATAFPPVFIDLNTIPSSSPIQIFNNITQGNSVTIAPSSTTIDTTHDFILPTANLTTLGWQPGDQIVYNCNGGSPISDLVCGSTYYLIVYSPGFSRNGLIENNKVDNCTISCYEDDAPVTSSAWVNNTAFNCGTPPSIPPSSTTNYTINFAGCRPIDVGSLEAYPKNGHKYFNLSLVPFGPPCPPKDFVGTLSHKSHSSSSSDRHYTIHAQWRPSPSNDVVAYNIYKDDQLIKTVPSNASLRVKIPTHSAKHLNKKFKITAVSSKNIEGKAAHLTIEEESSSS